MLSNTFNCSTCGGSGECATSHVYRCYECNGTGKVDEKKHREQFRQSNIHSDSTYMVRRSCCPYHSDPDERKKDIADTNVAQLHLKITRLEKEIAEAEKEISRWMWGYAFVKQENDRLADEAEASSWF